jgi:hypothetical protein
VGMALLPDNMDIDPGLLSMVGQSPIYRNKSARAWCAFTSSPSRRVNL